MAHPKRKISKTRRDKRRTHDNLGFKQIYTDPKTGGEEKKWQVYTTTESGIIMPGFERTTTKIIRPSGAWITCAINPRSPVASFMAVMFPCFDSAAIVSTVMPTAERPGML